MITLTHNIVGHGQVTVRFPQTQSELLLFQQWWNDLPRDAWVGCDTETTGLNIYSNIFQIRTLQLSYGLESWVLDLNLYGKDFSLLKGRQLVFQNAAYDLLAIRRTTGYQHDWGLVCDTKILAHLVDSRGATQGGTGHSLAELCAAYVDPVLAEEVKLSVTKHCQELKIKKSDYFKKVELTDPMFLRYAGLDPIITSLLRNKLIALVPPESKHLIPVEHNIARICAEMTHNGFKLDIDYTKQAIEEYTTEAEIWEAYALAEHGVESVNSAADLAEGLIESGVKLTKLTPSGSYKLTDDILRPLAEDGNMLATAAIEAKRAKKWVKTWLQNFLDEVDSNGYCHAWINPLQARTGRMTITTIPAQTLPSDDWRIRRCFIPEPNHSIVSCDYQAQELRVLAALSGDRNMRLAFKNGEDLHQMTANASGVERSVGKTVNFAYVYGSGPGNIAKTCGITYPLAKRVIEGFENTYPKVKQYSERLAKQAKETGQITTPSGRVLKVDSNRAYAALNYMIQSTSRDITCAALVRLDQHGITPYLKLPVHDEIIASVPTKWEQYAAEKIANIMATDFMGVHIGTDHEVYGPSWGHGYM